MQELADKEGKKSPQQAGLMKSQSEEKGQAMKFRLVQHGQSQANSITPWARSFLA